MTKTTFDSIIASRLEHKQVESTLYMPSMYDTSDEDDARDERSPTDRQKATCSSTRFALQRCLAWSVDDQEEERVQRDQEEAEHDDEERMDPGTYSEGSINMVKSFGSVYSAVVDATSSMDLHSTTESRVRPVHWEEQVTVEKRLDSFLSGKQVTADQR
eukprot:CAMPEP_0178754400 /NCGR_PEP_ID=MMETSP0744-20121128/12138_1 /TAXON_ID=913974 /ORGANISM="Nitzschia punctata, Strain CCMP561" /LENGTH=158 /DNA_ID=CAMNT_0020408307 /DNA_START=204 /DNA_END=683 /DNA_ORIENTATION=-